LPITSYNLEILIQNILLQFGKGNGFREIFMTHSESLLYHVFVVEARLEMLQHVLLEIDFLAEGFAAASALELLLAVDLLVDAEGGGLREGFGADFALEGFF
jgi:hypothetical protein